MKTMLFAVALMSLPAAASEAEAEVRFALSVSSASLIAASSSVIGGVLALSVPSLCTEQLGKPSPMCGVAGLAIAGATQLLISLLIIPELFRISGGDPAAVRAGWWRWARWPAALLAVSALVFLAGSAAEQQHYGTAQGTMITGLGGAAVSGVSIDVLGLIGAVKAARERSPPQLRQVP